jgi:hypothetical protein
MTDVANGIADDTAAVRPNEELTDGKNEATPSTGRSNIAKVPVITISDARRGTAATPSMKIIRVSRMRICAN